MIKLGAVTKKAEADQIIYCALIFAILFTSWYQLQRYLSKYYRNNLAHVLLLFAQCASVSQVKTTQQRGVPSPNKKNESEDIEERMT